ncbi:MAG: glutamate dehydrogenase [Myxococcota bacterium]
MAQSSLAETMLDAVTRTLTATAERVVPWFLEQMPADYFVDTDEAEQRLHLRAIITARASEAPMTLLVKSQQGSVWTFLREKDRPGLLADLLREVPKDAPLQSSKAYSAKDGSLVLDTFRFGDPPRFDPRDADLAVKRTEVLEHGERSGKLTPELRDAMGPHFEACAHAYLRVVRVPRIWEHFTLCRRLAGTDDTVVGPAEDSKTGRVRVNVAVGGARPAIVFERVCRYLGLHHYSIRRAYLDVFHAPKGLVAIVGLVFDDDPRLLGERPGYARLAAGLRRLRWVDGDTLRLAERHHAALSLEEAEVVVALARLAHVWLNRRDENAYARDRILLALDRHPALAGEIARLFLARFASRMADETLVSEAQKLDQRIQQAVLNPTAGVALRALVGAIGHVLRCNVHLPHRQGLALRIDPALLCGDGRPVPFGVFFVHGRGFDAFHVRFRDVARGGVRAVKPRGGDQHAIESQRLFDEAYDLASAQQLKNKDIPEGGAKAVVLLAPDASVDPSVRAFADGLLDLISPAEQSHLVDYFGQPERLYLGPDENISPDMIEWVVARGAVRGYPEANVLMSSKPGAGINHKEYGVTSEGVNVFLEEALRYVGLDPTAQPFTVKLTGGPDGDVAGNAINILFREYGENVRIVGIADGSGSAEDPDGLDRTALLELVRTSAAIAEFPAAALGPRGRVTPVDDPEGPYRRNTLHNRVVADAFVPAGGRPSTIHKNNWRDYLGADGTPSSRIIVEGANLFLTPDARSSLSDAGVLIVKDSSANKCGVITSSFEIAAGMLISEEALLEEKPRFVDEVLARLREVARAEAQILLREHRARSGSVTLPALSVRLSQAVERVADALFAAFPVLDREQPQLVARLVTDHLPPLLVERGGDRIASLADAYRAGIVASSLATRLVYREGLDIVDGATDEALVGLALRYLQAEDETESLIALIRSSNVPERERIATLLELGGPRASLLLTTD